MNEHNGYEPTLADVQDQYSQWDRWRGPAGTMTRPSPPSAPMPPVEPPRTRHRMTGHDTPPRGAPGNADQRTPSGNDSRHRAAAEEIQRLRPDWMIIFGAYTRRYWAYALFPARRRVILHADHRETLIALIDRAECELRIQPEQENDRSSER